VRIDVNDKDLVRLRNLNDLGGGRYVDTGGRGTYTGRMRGSTLTTSEGQVSGVKEREEGYDVCISGLSSCLPAASLTLRPFGCIAREPPAAPVVWFCQVQFVASTFSCKRSWPVPSSKVLRRGGVRRVVLPSFSVY